MKLHFFLFFLCTLFIQAQVQVRKEMDIMHSPSYITIVGKDSIEANKYIKIAVNEMQRIEDLISEWNPSSEVSKINENAGIKPVKVSKEVFDFIERSIKISVLTDGAFDLSWASVNKIWKFDGSMKQLPTKEEVKKSIKLVNYKNIILNSKNQTVYLKLKGMKIGTGGNGQGFGADKTKQLLQQKGVASALLNISGDVCAWGKQANEKNWIVGVNNPLNKNKIFAWFDLNEKSFTTSGNYEKFVEFDKKKYCHIIDPRTGFPVDRIASASVFSNSTELSDTLDTALIVMGKDAGMFLINQLPNVECIMVDTNNNVYYSNGLIKNKINL